MDKWEETKRYLRSLPANWRRFLEERMKESPDSVRTITDNSKGRFFEYRFYLNGYECFVQAQEFTDTKQEDFYRILAFNDEKNVCFVREPLKERI